MRKIKRTLSFISLTVSLWLLVACGSELTVPLVPSEVIQGTWAMAWIDENGEADFNLHVFEFASDGTFERKVGFLGASMYLAGTYEFDESSLFYNHESGDLASHCSDRSSSLEIKSLEQNKITTVMKDNPCFEDTVGAEIVFARCEWPPNAETDPFANCKLVNSE